MFSLLLLLACEGAVDFQDSGGGPGPGTDPVDETPPVVALVSPDAAVRLAGMADVTATVSDEGTVASVRFELDGALLIELSAEPWTVPLDTTTLPNGEHDLRAVATDGGGNEGEAAIRVTVENAGISPDVLNIISPLANAVVCGEVPIEAFASMAVVSGTLFVNGEEKATDTELPLSWGWNSAGRDDGVHQIAVVATFADGSSVVDRVDITTKNQTGTCSPLPTVRITKPKGGSGVGAAAVVEVTATDDGGVARVVLSVDGTEITTWTDDPYTWTWDTTTLADGEHVLSAVATDTRAQTTETRNLVTIDHTAPRARLTNPLDGDIVNGTVSVTAEITDNVAVAAATLYVDGTSLGKLTAEPWTWIWDASLESGPVELEVRANDEAGNAAVDSVRITVDNLPTVRHTAPADGDVISGIVALSASAIDNEGALDVAWDYDGIFITSDATSPYRGSFDTCNVPTGLYTLTVTASDSNSQSAIDSVDVMVEQPYELELETLPSALSAEETLRAWTTDDVATVSIVWEMDGVEFARADTGAADAGCNADCPDLCTLFETTLDVAALSDGSHTLTVTATNSAGDEVSESRALTVEYDLDADGYDGTEWGGTDCDDDDDTVNPGMEERCDGLDQNCDGTADEDFDLDLDGFTDEVGCTDGTDCDDDDAAVNPDATDSCDGVDNNCDDSIDTSGAPTTDSGLVTAGTLTASLTDQAWGNVYTAERDMTLTSFDARLDPGSASVRYSVLEADTTTGEFTLLTTATVVHSGSFDWYNSGDLNAELVMGRAYLLVVGSTSSMSVRYERGAGLGTVASLAPAGFLKHTGSSAPASESDDPDSGALFGQQLYVTWIENDDLDLDADGQTSYCGDCDDTDSTRSTDLNEACDGVDNDCDGSTPATEADNDSDGDRVCDSDCDDADAARYPSAIESCDGVDNDCDGVVGSDEADNDGDGVAACYDSATGLMDCDDTDASTLLTTYYADNDDDGFGDDSLSSSACPPIAGWVALAGDCDDTDSAANAGATESCDGVDNNCDGAVDEGFDADSDGVGSCYDCDDSDATVSPNTVEVCGNTVDEDCDGAAPDCRWEGDVDLATSDTLLFGEEASAYLGQRSAAGDFNGDGQLDLLLASYSSSIGGVSNAGALYVLPGPITGDVTVDTSSASRIDGESSSDALGLAIGAADFDGDGLDDVAASAYADDDGGSNAGAVYVILAGDIASGRVPSAAAKLVGETTSDYFGYGLMPLGDVDGDGKEDLAVGAYGADAGGSSAGAAYVFLGPVTADRDASLADAKFVGESSSDQAGYTVGGGGDLDGNGLNDLLVGASSDDDGGSGAGAVYVVTDAITSADLSLAAAKFIGSEASDAVGLKPSRIADVNGDGWDDLLISGYLSDGDASDSGVLYLFYGPVTASASVDAADASLLGEAYGDCAGCSFDVADFDADGSTDVLVGAYGNGSTATAAGATYLVYGPLAGSRSLSAADAVFLGESASDASGFSMLAPGDLSGDGGVDFLIGAYASSLSASSAGVMYLFPGGN